MRVKYTKTVLFMVLCAFLVLMLVGLAVGFWCDGEVGGIMVIALLLAIVAVGLWFYFRFGIFIGKTRVTVYDGDTFKIFRKSEIKYIKVDIDENTITAVVRVNSREYGWQNHAFAWEPVRALRSRHGWCVIRQYFVIDDAFVRKTTQTLSRFEKASVTDKRGSEH